MSFHNITRRHITRMLTAAAFTVTAFTAAASADEAGYSAPKNLQAWAKGAARSVDDVMYYPSFAVTRGAEGIATLNVTIDKKGDVLASEWVEKPRHNMIRRAAARVVERLDLPAIPSSHGRDRLKFQLQLTYAIDGGPLSRSGALRPGTVRGEPVASNRGPLTASITILSGDDD